MHGGNDIGGPAARPHQVRIRPGSHWAREVHLRPRVRLGPSHPDVSDDADHRRRGSFRTSLPDRSGRDRRRADGRPVRRGRRYSVLARSADAIDFAISVRANVRPRRKGIDGGRKVVRCHAVEFGQDEFAVGRVRTPQPGGRRSSFETRGDERRGAGGRAADADDPGNRFHPIREVRNRPLQAGRPTSARGAAIDRTRDRPGSGGRSSRRRGPWPPAEWR